MEVTKSIFASNLKLIKIIIEVVLDLVVSFAPPHARVVELVDTLDLKSNGNLISRAGSSPASGTNGSVNHYFYWAIFVLVEHG